MLSGTGGYMKIEHAFSKFIKYSLKTCYIQDTVKGTYKAIDLVHAPMELPFKQGK